MANRPLAVLHDAAPPGQRADQKQPDRAQEDEGVQGGNEGNFAQAKRQHVEEAARRIDPIGIHDVLPDRGPARKQSRRRERLHRQIQRERHQRGECQQPAWTKQQRQHDEPGKRIFGEDVAVPDQAQMNDAEHQQHGEPAQQQRGAACAVGEPVELNGKACAEQQREQRKGLELDGLGQDRLDGAIDWRCQHPRTKKLVEDRNAKFHHEVDGHDAEQGDAPQHVDGVDPLGGRRRPGECGAIGRHGGIPIVATHSVIASAAKQSRVFPRRQSDCFVASAPRNDGGRSGAVFRRWPAADAGARVAPTTTAYPAAFAPHSSAASSPRSTPRPRRHWRRLRGSSRCRRGGRGS